MMGNGTLRIRLGCLVGVWLLIVSAVAVGIVIGMMLAPRAEAAAPRPAPDPTALLRPVDVSGSEQRASDPTRTGEPAPAEPGTSWPVGPQSASDPARDARAGGDGAPILSERTPQPSARPSPTVGVASWYGGSRGWHGVPHVALPSGRWTGAIGAHAVVCVFAGGRSRCATLPVVDCLCGGIPGRIVDLSIEAVRLLDLDPARGLWPASVEVLR